MFIKWINFLDVFEVNWCCLYLRGIAHPNEKVKNRTVNTPNPFTLMNQFFTFYQVCFCSFYNKYRCYCCYLFPYSKCGPWISNIGFIDGKCLEMQHSRQSQPHRLRTHILTTCPAHVLKLGKQWSSRTSHCSLNLLRSAGLSLGFTL